MSITVMICFARSGGTVLNQCLGSLPNVVILSEVNPLGGGDGKGDVSVTTVKDQAKHWYDIEIKSEGFADEILELEKVCTNKGKHLIVRDWSFVNFVPWQHNNMNSPDSLLILEELRGRSELKPFAFVRDSIDVWISRGANPEVETFFAEYLKYVKAIVKENIPMFKYEDFCKDPDHIIKKICDYTGIEYSDSYKNYSSFTTVNGDVQRTSPSRGAKQSFIRTLPRKSLSREKMKRLNGVSPLIDDMREANRLLDYPTYDDGIVLRENLLNRIIKKYFI